MFLHCENKQLITKNLHNASSVLQVSEVSSDFRLKENLTRHDTSRAFTLVEMLAVIAVIAIGVALLAPVVPGIVGSKGMTRAVTEVASILEQCKAEAITRRSYVYVAFVNATNSSGKAEMRIGAAISRDGSGSNVTAGNLRPLTKVFKIENVRVVDYSGLAQSIKDIAPAEVRDSFDYVLNFAAPGVSFTISGQTFASGIIIISPKGEILPQQNSRMFRPRAAVGLMAMRGQTINANDGAIVAYQGNSGAINITRP